MAAHCNSIPKPSGVLLVQCDAVSPTENELMSRQDIQACVFHRQPAAVEQKPERLCFSGNVKVRSAYTGLRHHTFAIGWQLNRC